MTDMDFRADAFLTNLEAEKIVLGTFFYEPEKLEESYLIPENFGSKRHEILYGILLKMRKKEVPIEIVAVVEEAATQLESIGGISYLTEIAVSVPTVTDFSYHMGLVLEYYKKRKVYQTAQTMMREALSLQSDDVIRNALDEINRLEENDIDDDDGHIKKILMEAYDWMLTDHGDIAGATTGFSDLDHMTNGLQKQDLVIIGGRPSIGKTAFAVNLVLNYVTLTNQPGVVFSLEMKALLLALRIISNQGNIDGQKIRNAMKNFGSSEWQRTTQVMASGLAELPLHLIDKTGVNIGYIRRKLRSLKRKYPDQHMVVMIDYLQLIQGDPVYKGNRTQEISEISRSLKSIARELDITIIALAQLSRNLESRADKRPMLSDLRESGQIEQDADIIMFLYRDDYYNKESGVPGLVEVILAKQRNGPVGTVELAFQKEYSKFINLKRGQ